VVRITRNAWACASLARLQESTVMNGVERDSKQRDRQIAQNEDARQVGSNIRLSTWAIIAAAAIILLGWLWMRH